MQLASIPLRRNRADAGFTLVELLIVIVILAVLTGAAIFAISGFGGKGALEACRTDVSTAQKAAEAYRSDGNPPANSIPQLQPYLKQLPPEASASGEYFVEIATGTVTGKLSDGTAC